MAYKYQPQKVILMFSGLGVLSFIAATIFTSIWLFNNTPLVSINCSEIEIAVQTTERISQSSKDFYLFNCIGN